MNKIHFIIVVLMTILITSCSTVLVDSSPSGAKVLIDGQDTGKLTPAGLRVRDLHSGYRSIELQKEGYVSSCQTLTVHVSAGKIFTSLFPPLLLKFGMGDCWKIAGPGRLSYTLSPVVSYKTANENNGSNGFVIDRPVAPQFVPFTQPSTGNLSKKIGGKRWAVVVGISNYKDSRIPALRYASSDAQAYYNWLVSPIGGKYAPSRVKLLTDEHATGVAIKGALFNWLKQALEEDMVTIYFAGHGSPESPDSPENLFLLTHDSKYDDIASTGFPMWDIETALKRFIKAKKVVVLADACHAAGVGHSFDVARRANRGLKVNSISSGLSDLSAVSPGVAIFSASAENQYSQESQKWGGGHGVFTYYLLKGLSGESDFNGDGAVNLGELNLYLSEQVRRATKNAQSPIVSGRFDPALTIGN